MDQYQFNFSVTREASNLVGELYSYPDITRAKAQNIIKLFSDFANQSAISMLFHSVIKRLEALGENQNNLASYVSMFQTVQYPFEKFNTEWKCFEYLKSQGWYIPPEEIKVESVYNVIDGSDSNRIDALMPVQFIPLRHVLKQFFELPGMMQQIMSYVHEVENEKNAISNVMQTQYWQEKKVRVNCSELLLPIGLYQDEVETNNALGSHRGRGKIGAVYIVLPFLPPHLISKTENIFLILLYNSYKQKKVPLVQIFGRVTEELLFLETTGIFVSTDSVTINLRFSIAAMVGDNLAVNTVMGFSVSFSATYSCRFCLASKSDLESISRYTECNMRTEETYNDGLAAKNSDETGIVGISSIPDITSSTTLELLAVDLWHDLLEGACQYDLGLVLKEFVKLPNFTCDIINERLATFSYFEDDVRNKPVRISETQLRDRVIKMSASEMLCLYRNIGILFGHMVTVGNKYWKLIILLRDIIDLAMTPVVYSWMPDYFASCISEYLSFRRELFPDTCKPKHHLLVHYPQVMKKLGPLKPFGTIRCESKNHDVKVPSKNSQNRLNNEKNLAIRNQLLLSRRLQKRHEVDSKPWEIEAFREIFAGELPDFSLYSTLLNCDANAKIDIVEKMTFMNCTLKRNAVIMIPNTEERKLFIIHVIIQDPKELVVFVTKEVTEFAHYSEHYQAHVLPQNFHSCKSEWRCLMLRDLNNAWFSFVTDNGPNEPCIPKRWI